MTDPYERMKIPTTPTQPWQLRHKWLLVIARFTKLILFPLYVVLYFPVVWPFMLIIGYLFWGDVKHFVNEKIISRYYSSDEKQWRADWSFWKWGELEKDDE